MEMSDSTKSNETKTPTAAKLRHVATKIAQDIAHAPLKSRNHEELQALNALFVASEKTMTATSDTITSAITHTQDLVMEAHRWTAVGSVGNNLTEMIDQSKNKILGIDSATASSIYSRRRRPIRGHSASVPTTPSILVTAELNHGTVATAATSDVRISNAVFPSFRELQDEDEEDEEEGSGSDLVDVKINHEDDAPPDGIKRY